MDSPTHSAVSRLEIVETGRRRRWSEDEKARIVLESLAGPRLVSATARRHGISRAQLLTWRRAFRPERWEAVPAPGFIPMMVASAPPSGSPPSGVPPGGGLPGGARSSRAREGRVEIVLPGGRRLIVDAEIEPAALARILAVLEPR